MKLIRWLTVSLSHAITDDPTGLNLGNPMDIIDSFTIGQTNFGANINYAPSVNKWVCLSAGTFSNFLITFCDQNLNIIQALDINILITLLFKFPSPNL